MHRIHQINVLVISVAFIFTIGYASASRNLSVCEFETENDGIIPPSVPEVFTMWSSVTDKLNRRTAWTKEIYDGVNKKAKLEVTVKGGTMHFVFDYLKQVMITYTVLHPKAINKEFDALSDSSCWSKEIKKVSPSMLPFSGFRYGSLTQDNKIRMFNQYQVLQFGGNYKFAYVKPDDEDPFSGMEREIPVNKFTGCVYNPFDDSTFRVNFSWAGARHFTEAGQKDTPIRKVLSGGYFVPDEKNAGKYVWKQKEEIHDIIFFESDPVLKEEDFQVPPRMLCTFEHSKKKLPEIPDAFSYRMETISEVRSMTGEQIVPIQVSNYMAWYDEELQIARFDYKPYPTNPFDLNMILEDDFLDETPITAVFDFNFGVAYYTHKSSRKCTSANIPISEYSFFVSKEKTKEGYPKLATPKEIFDILGIDFKYKGKYINRGLKCDVWSSKYETSSGDSNTTIHRDLYFTTEDARVESGERTTYKVPVRDTEVAYVKDKNTGEWQQHIVESNIFAFKAEDPDLSDFDVEGCIEQLNRRYFWIYFKYDKSAHDQVIKHQNQFLQNSRMAIYYHSGIGSILRIQRLQAEFEGHVQADGRMGVRVIFILLERNPAWNTASKQAVTINEARQNLFNAIRAQKVIAFIKSEGMIEAITLVATNLYEYIPFDVMERRKRNAEEVHGLLANLAADVNNDGADDDEGSDVNSDGGDDDNEDDVNKDGENDTEDSTEDDSNETETENQDKKKQKSGMTQGGLIGLGIGFLIIGALIGIGVMWFLLKRGIVGMRRTQDDNQGIVMQDSSSTGP